MSSSSEGSPLGTRRHSVLFKLLHGVALGCGFGLGLVAVLMTADAVKQRFERSHSAETKATEVWKKRFTSDAKLMIEHQELRTSRWNVVALGSVRNDGQDSWQYVRLELRLFDAPAHIVHICTGTVNGAVRPGKSRYFSVDCGDSEREPTPAYNTYEVEVVDAGYEMDNGA